MHGTSFPPQSKAMADEREENPMFQFFKMWSCIIMVLMRQHAISPITSLRKGESQNGGMTFDR